jgi:fimbrial isopeptide formation D2 family protein
MPARLKRYPGEIITYTLTQELTLPGEFTITYGLKDTLPPELIVLVETIHLNGQPAPELYDPDQHTISFSDIGNYEGMTEITITYQVQIDPEITEAIEIANEIESQAEIGDYLLQAPEPVIFNLSVLEAPQLTHSKTANTTEAVPGDIITYTLTQQLALPKDLLVTHSLTDTLPPELIVLTETIQLDGQPAPELYDPDEHTIVYSQTGTFDGITVTITYQAQINAEIMLDIDLENLLTSQASVNAVQVSAPEPVIESVHVTPVIWHFYIPITIRN